MESEDLPKLSSRIAEALQHTGTLLIKRGTVMGPLVPALSLVPVLGFLAWLLADVFVVSGIPIYSTLCFAGIFAVVGIYLAQYARFAKQDPDRLQSEEYRVQMRKLQMTRLKDEQEYIPADELAEPSAMLDVSDETSDNQTTKSSIETSEYGDESK